MKPTNFSKYITGFLSKYLPNERGASPNTISSYRDTFVLLILYMQSVKNIRVEKLTLEKITRQTVLDFLEWLQQERKSNSSTRNARLAAIHSFYSYLQYESIDFLHEAQRIISIKFKKAPQQSMSYFSIDGIRLLLQQPDMKSARGRRDLTMLSLMYDTGCRVQELIDLTPSSIKFSKPITIRIIGKGNKARIVPLLDGQVDYLKNHLRENGLEESHVNVYPLFANNRKEKLTRAGIGYILQKYVDTARKIDGSLMPKKVSPHALRHSKAMHLLQAGVNIVYIRDILGHVSIQSTEIYARADSKQKRDAIEKAYVNVNPDEESMWSNNSNLLTWLKTF